jgi:dihydrofolate reductase
MRVNIIAVMARSPFQGAIIGVDGELPFKDREDMRRFRRLTWGRAVIMGRKTYESIGKPLEGRRNIVITSQEDFKSEGVEVVHSVEQALETAKSSLVGHGIIREEDEIWIIGGGEVYEQTISLADRLYISEMYEPVPQMLDQRLTAFPHIETANYNYIYSEACETHFFVIYSKTPLFRYTYLQEPRWSL